MTKMIKKTFAAPDEIRSFEKSRIEVVKLGEAEVIRVTNQSGWSRSNCVKPLAGTNS